jgi:dolichol-phosphate mannosyltransferase
MKTLVIVPTYNERENIGPMIQALLGLKRGYHITGEVVKSFSQNNPEVHLLSRAGKEGLGRAYIAGFKWGLEKGYEAIVEMDADFSHRPQDLIPLLEKLSDHDFAVGSRYVDGGRTVNWGIGRKIISRGGSLYSRLILGFPLNDWTGGFNAWKSHVLQSINLDGVKSNGYSFQIELKYKALKKGFRGAESPIVFEDRRVGQSKMSLKIVVEAFYRVWLLRAK